MLDLNFSTQGGELSKYEISDIQLVNEIHVGINITGSSSLYYFIYLYITYYCLYMKYYHQILAFTN